MQESVFDVRASVQAGARENKLRCKMAKRTKNNIIVLIALAVLCLTASGSFWTGGQADAVYSPPVWDLPLFEADDAPESVEPSAEPAEPAVEAYGGTLTALYINGAYSTDCRIIDGKVRMTLAEFAGVTGLAYSESALDGIQLHLAEGGEYVEVNGRYLYLEGGLLVIDGTELWPVSELCRIFGFTADWDSATASVNIDTTQKKLIESGDNFYSEEDVYWLSRIIYAESGNQPLTGMLGVGDVVMNRVASAAFPNTVKEVIFDSRYGVQFSPVETGSIYSEPSEECVIAAKICLEGYDIVGGALYFVNPDIGVSSWFRQTRTFVTSIGDHDFYA